LQCFLLEGLIGKRAGSRYEAGRRSGAWIKVKLHLEQEFVIGGYTEREGSRKYFGALLVAFTKVRSLNLLAELGRAPAKSF
jgi:bifunctional non-homologous end joining protein LigD